MDFFDAYAVNEDLENNGAEHTIGGVKFLVARAGNTAYGELLQKLYKKNRAALEVKGDKEAKKKADALSDSIMIEVMAATILKGWEGEVKLNGDSLTYSVENAKKLLALKEFRREIGRLSEDFSFYKAKQDAEDEKN